MHIIKVTHKTSIPVSHRVLFKKEMKCLIGFYLRMK
jgi:hypothetical protein